MGPAHQWTWGISTLIASGDDCLKCRRILLYVTPQSNALNQDQIVWHIGSIPPEDRTLASGCRYPLRFSVWPPIPYPHWRRAFICHRRLGIFFVLLLLFRRSMSSRENNGGWAAIDKCFNLRQGRRWGRFCLSSRLRGRVECFCGWRVHQWFWGRTSRSTRECVALERILLTDISIGMCDCVK